MPEVLYDAHPALLRTRPFGTLLMLLLMVGGGLVAVVDAQALPPHVVHQIDVRMLQMVGLGVLVFAALQLLVWWLMAHTDHLAITPDEILWTHGLLSKQYTEISLTSVRTVRVTQTLFQRLVNAGDISLYTAGDAPELVLRGLPDPGRLRELIKAPPASEA